MTKIKNATHAKKIAAEFKHVRFWWDRYQRLWTCSDKRVEAATEYLAPGWLYDMTEDEFRAWMKAEDDRVAAYHQSACEVCGEPITDEVTYRVIPGRDPRHPPCYAPCHATCYFSRFDMRIEKLEAELDRDDLSADRRSELLKFLRAAERSRTAELVTRSVS